LKGERRCQFEDFVLLLQRRCVYSDWRAENPAEGCGDEGQNPVVAFGGDVMRPFEKAKNDPELGRAYMNLKKLKEDLEALQNAIAQDT